MAAAAPRILHLLAAFDDADPGARRLVRLINALGRKAEHALVADDRERRGAARQLSKGARISWPRFPPLTGSKLPGRLLKLAAAMRGYNLICTWGPGALDAAFAHTLFADVHKLAPLVHHELGAEPGAVGGRRRAWYRRFALGRAAALVVPTRALETIATGPWDQPRTRVRLIPDGIDTRAYAAPARRDLLPGLIKRREEKWLGLFADADPDHALEVLRTLADLAPEWQLVIVGEPTARTALEAKAAALELEDRLHFAGPVDDHPGMLALLDLVSLPATDISGATMIQAMAAGLPIVTPRGGEAGAALASDNGPLLFTPGDTAELGEVLGLIAARPDERRRIGQANRTRARAEFDAQRMVDRSWALYSALAGGSGHTAPASGDPGRKL